MVAILQAAIITQTGGSWAGSFGSSVSANSSVVLLPDVAASSGAVTVGSPTFAGSTPGNAATLWSFTQGSTNVVNTSGYLLPNVAGGSAAVGVTVTGGGNFGDDATGLWGIEVAALGA